MPVNTKRLRYLLSKNVAKQCSRDEMEELYRLIVSADDDTVYNLLNEIYRTAGQDTTADDVDWEYMLADILRYPQVPKEQARTKLFTIKRLMIAASVLLLLGLGIYHTMPDWDKEERNMAVAGRNDVLAPGANRSTVTLDDGTIIALDSLNNGVLAQDEGMRIVKLANGQIAYRTADGKEIMALRYNTITNPRGSKVIDVTLSDGSRVWLNAGSSIKFPVVFIGTERKVALTGEGYFEVAASRNPTKGGEKKKFVVVANGTATEVLGTKFNVNAYAEEPDTKVTLLEGSVRLKLKAGSLMLKPGQQGVARHSALSLQPSADIDQIMAWKNGLFSFNGSSLREVMQQIARWYDLDVVYEGSVSEKRFGGKIFKDANLSEVMNILEGGGVRYEIKNQKTIIIKSE
ncbi:MAG: DUF4974 domain-containing protein [Niabella sp.]